LIHLSNSFQVSRPLFGCALNTQVATTSEGVLQTIKPVKNCFYEFYLVGGNKLVATEVGRFCYLTKRVHGSGICSKIWLPLTEGSERESEVIIMTASACNKAKIV
jgi:hypothetical protein